MAGSRETSTEWDERPNFEFSSLVDASALDTRLTSRYRRTRRLCLSMRIIIWPPFHHFVAPFSALNFWQCTRDVRVLNCAGWLRNAQGHPGASMPDGFYTLAGNANGFRRYWIIRNIVHKLRFDRSIVNSPLTKERTDETDEGSSNWGALSKGQWWPQHKGGRTPLGNRHRLLSRGIHYPKRFLRNLNNAQITDKYFINFSPCWCARREGSDENYRRTSRLTHHWRHLSAKR